MTSAVAEVGGQGSSAVKARLESLYQQDAMSPFEPALEEAATIRGLLERNSEELEALLRAMNGEYILPEAGGDLLRDGAAVLPTGEPGLGSGLGLK